MSLFGRALVVAITAALMLPFGTPPGAASHDTAGNLASQPEGNAVTDWSLIAQTAIAEGRPPGSSQVLHGIVHAAMYDAVIAIEGGFEHYTISPEVDRPAAPAAAVAAAAHDVLVARVPAQAPHVDALYEEYLNAIPDRSAKTNGIAVGRTVAAGIIALRADDRFDNDVPYVQPSPGPGVFEPTPPPANPVDVKLAHVRRSRSNQLPGSVPAGPPASPAPATPLISPRSPLSAEPTARCAPPSRPTSHASGRRTPTSSGTGTSGSSPSIDAWTSSPRPG
jgi:hypothetical protein